MVKSDFILVSESFWVENIQQRELEQSNLEKAISQLQGKF